MAFYTIFEQLCNEENISPAQVRTDLGISQSTMASWKSRNLTPKAETIQKLADYFGVPVDYLLGVGQRVSATDPNRRIYKILRDKKWSLQKLSTETKLPIEILRKFALGDRVEDGRDCLEKIAGALHANPAYLMGWTVYEDDEMPYLEITEEMWRLSDNDPAAAHGLQQFAEDEEYQRAENGEERQGTENRSPELFKVGDSYYGGALRIADVEEKSDSEFSVTFHVDEDGMEAKELITLFEMLQSMSSKHGVSIDGLTQLAKMVQAVAAKELVQEDKTTPQEDDNT